MDQLIRRNSNVSAIWTHDTFWTQKKVAARHPFEKLLGIDKHGFKTRDSVHQFCWAIQKQKPHSPRFPRDGPVKARELKILGDIYFLQHASTVYIYIIHTWNPNDPCFEYKRPCFPKTKDKWVPGICRKLHLHIFALHFSLFNSRWLELIYPNRACWNCCHLHCWGQDLSPEMQKKRLEQEQAGWQKRKLHLWHSVYHHLANLNGHYFLNGSSCQLNFKKSTSFFVNFAEFNPFNFDERAAIGPTSAR